ncbi:MAG: ATP-binding protein [Candidatus Thorarchaeota archaeon]
MHEPLVDTSLTDTIISISNEFKRIREDVELTLELGAAEARVLADGYINVLLLNLLENAVIHNPNRRKRVWVKLNSVVDGFEVRIADNGLGLSDKQKIEILDPSRRFGGIGVHQARNIVNKYGGHLFVVDRVRDEPTKGAEFRIFFPRRERDDRPFL